MSYSELQVNEIRLAYERQAITQASEIARLQAEVERLTDFIRHIGKVNGEMHGGMVAVAKSEIAAAWNDAIEAAATILDSEFSRLFADAEKYRGGSNPHHEHKAFAEAAKKQSTAIRALKRPTP